MNNEYVFEMIIIIIQPVQIAPNEINEYVPFYLK